MSADPYSLLLESYASGSPGGADMQQLLAQLGETDPRIGLLSKYLANRREAESEAEGDDGAGESAAEAAAREREKEKAVRALQRVARSMYGELEGLRERNDTLAAALGACYLCWGQDVQCEVCDGQGVPGSAPPDAELFSMIVVPAIRRVQQQRRRAGASPSPVTRRADVTDRATNSDENLN